MMLSMQEAWDSWGKDKRWTVIKQSSLIVVIVALIGSFSLLNPRFFTPENTFNIVRQISILLLVALGGTFVILMGGIDFSVGSIINLAGIITGYFVFELHAWAIPVGLLVGMACGTINGVTVTKLKIPSFIGTLGTLSLFQGLALIISDGRYRLFDDPGFIAATQGTLIGRLPNISLWAIAIQVLCILIAYQTVFGRYTYAIGSGEAVSRASGVPVVRYKLYAFMFSGSLAGLGGALLASRLASTTPNMGDGFLIDSIAAIVVGGTAITGGVGGPEKTLLGAILLGVLSSGMNIVGITPFVQTALKGMIIIIAVALTLDREKISIVK
jgi:ribose transport system permease protein